MLIRDPVHGDIDLAPLEAQVLDLPVVQRLRGIKQLGTAYLVYPGCLHTRFDHSLGVCRVSHVIVSELRRQGIGVDARLEQLIGCAALLHDVTHVPFGHTLEDERRLFARHDKGNRLARLLDGELGEGLAAIGIGDEVAALLTHGTALPRWAADVVSSTIDADLLDYLRRDSLFAGLQQGYDDRIFHYFTVADGRLALEMTKHGMERPDARSEIVQVLRMRYFLTERVYYHHTKVIAGAMISKAVELALGAGALTEAELLGLNDWTLLERLRGAGPGAARLIERLLRRDLLKRGYVISAQRVELERRRALVARYHEVAGERQLAEAEIARSLGVPADDVIVYCPALTTMKEAAAAVRTPRGVESLNRAASAGISEIHAMESRYEDLWRFYVLVPREAALACAAVGEEYFGLPSEHTASCPA